MSAEIDTLMKHVESFDYFFVYASHHCENCENPDVSEGISDMLMNRIVQLLSEADLLENVDYKLGEDIGFPSDMDTHAIRVIILKKEKFTRSRFERLFKLIKKEEYEKYSMAILT